MYGHGCCQSSEANQDHGVSRLDPNSPLVSVFGDYQMVIESDDAVKDEIVSEAVRKDMRRVARRWQAYNMAVPHANPIFFLAEIIRTGRLPRVPKKPVA